MPSFQDAESRLDSILRDCGSLLVAYSGGVDSAYLAWRARQVLGPKSLAVIGDSASLARSEMDKAQKHASEMGFPLRLIRTREGENPDYVKNAQDRCYFCKSELFTKLIGLAREEGWRHLACGDNADDESTDRPGMRAARGLGVKSPLREAGLRKEAIRSLARGHGLPVWDKPATACLASRIPHGISVTVERLAQVERAEEVLRDLDFRQIRVRWRGPKAYVQVGPDEVSRLQDPKLLESVATGIRQAGFEELEVDPRGYLGPTGA